STVVRRLLDTPVFVTVNPTIMLRPRRCRSIGYRVSRESDRGNGTCFCHGQERYAVGSSNGAGVRLARLFAVNEPRRGLDVRSRTRLSRGNRFLSISRVRRWASRLAVDSWTASGSLTSMTDSQTHAPLVLIASGGEWVGRSLENVLESNG